MPGAKKSSKKNLKNIYGTVMLYFGLNIVIVGDKREEIAIAIIHAHM